MYSPGGVFNPLMLVVTKGHTYTLKQTWKYQLKVCLTYMIKKDRGIDHANLLLYLERYTASLFEMVYYTQQLTRKYKQHNLSLGRVVWWVKALHSELEGFHFKPLQVPDQGLKPNFITRLPFTAGWRKSETHSLCQ